MSLTSEPVRGRTPCGSRGGRGTCRPGWHMGFSPEGRRGGSRTWRVLPPRSAGQAPVAPRAPGIRAQAANSICFSPKEKSFGGCRPRRGRPAARGPHPLSGLSHGFIQMAASPPHTGSQSTRHTARRHCPGPCALQLGCWSSEPWPQRGNTACSKPPHSPPGHRMGADGPRTRKFCVEHPGPRITPGRRAATSQDPAWVRNNCRGG